MASPQKDKGSRYERALVKRFHELGITDAVRTKAGYERDAGDLHLYRTPSRPEAICQAKHVKTPNWTEWLDQLADQKDESQADTAFLAVRRSRPGKSPIDLFVMPLDEGIELLKKSRGEPM